MGPPHPSRDGDGAGLDRLGAIEAVPDVRPANRPRVDRTSWRSRSTARSPTGVALSSSTPWSASTVSCAAACAKPAGRSTCHEPSRSECCRWCGHAKANWANRFNDGLDPARLTPAAGDDPRHPWALLRWVAGAQPPNLAIRQIRETLLAARLLGGLSMAGACPHRRRRAAASEEVSCLGEQRERSIAPARMWPGRRFRPPLAAAASQLTSGDSKWHRGRAPAFCESVWFVANRGMQARTARIMRFSLPHDPDGRPCLPTHHPRIPAALIQLVRTNPCQLHTTKPRTCWPTSPPS
jgi:hypothetical protein